MLLNYFKLAVRLLIRNPFFTLLNITCLSVGFAVFFILWQHSQNELHSDQFHKDYERIVRTGIIMNSADDVEKTFGCVPAGFSVRMEKDFGDFEEAVAIYNQGNFESPIFGHRNDLFISTINDKNEKVRFAENNISYADSNVFNFFSIPLIKGNASSVLGELRATVLSQSTAEKYFGDSDPVGKILYLNDSFPLKVTGVFEDLPPSTHLNFSIVISSLNLGLENYKGYQMAHTYFKLIKGVAHEELQDKLSHFSQVYFQDFIKASNNTTNPQIFFEPLKEVAYNWYIWDTFTAKSKQFLIVLSILSIGILGMAWVNYINLTLAGNQKRMKELAARKAVGATTRDIVKQFVIESILINTISFLAAITIAQLVKGPVAILFQFHVPEWTQIEAPTWGILIAVLVSGVLISGLYPAFITLQNSPKVLFGTSKKGGSRNVLSQILTTFQYAAATVLVAWVVSINLQLNFILTKDLGINKESIIVIDLPGNRDQDFESSLSYFIKQAELSPGIVSTTVSSSVVGDFNPIPLVLERNDGNNFAVDTNGGVDEKFLPFYGLKLIAGRNFLPDNSSDKRSIIISKTTTEVLGFSTPEDALGFEFKTPQVRVIGVVENYALRPLLSQYASESRNIRGIGLLFGNTLEEHLAKNKISIKIRPGMTDRVIATLAKEFNVTFPASFFHWYYLDDHVNQYYTDEKIFRRQILLFTGIAIGIACLGLLGMISNKVLESTKEIGIRKVLGATLHQIAGLLLKTTVRQITIATIIGIPIAYYLVQEYLQKFSERITLSWWHYLLPVFIFLVIMLATITTILINAAKANPVDSLRHE